ncbi:MAG: S8 family serine peptidase [Gaiellaceae bacterium]
MPTPAHGGASGVPNAQPVQVIVELAGSPMRSAARTTASLARLRSLAGSQRELESAIETAVPEARVHWRYRRVLNALAVVAPRSALAAIERLPGVESVTPGVPYGPSLDASPALIGAASTWRPGLSNLGEGVKIGIIDDGIDAKSPLFDPTGFAMPEGFPLGDTRFTTPKVIVARAFTAEPAPVPASRLPFDRKRSQHATHVAGIAAGVAGVLPSKLDGRPRLPLSGVAPRAYLGNYRALTYPTESGVGLNGNSPEILAAIEAAVGDGMDVINLSLGQPEIAPQRDLVAKALDNAAAAGVIVVVAAGNDFIEQGAGSISSPGTARDAITVGATNASRAYGVQASLLTAPSGVAVGTVRLTPIAGSGVATLGAASFQPLTPESTGPDLTLCTAPAEELPTSASSVATATAGGCTLRAKAKNAAAYGASAVLVADGNSATYRSRVKTAAVPVFVATQADVNAVVALARTASSPRLTLSSEPAVIATSDIPRIAPFSAQGPTPLSTRLKPDVVAPGVSIYSAFPVRDGSFGLFSGTSMAAPHVAGGAALLKELHADWTPAQIKSALVVTGRAVRATSGSANAVPSRAGGGLVDLDEAASPLIHAAPSGISFELVRAPAKTIARRQEVELFDAGGGSAPWSVSNVKARTTNGASIELPPTVVAPGTLVVTLRVRRTAREGDVSGWIVLERAGIERRIPYWARIVRPQLPRTTARKLRRTGTYSANNKQSGAIVDGYRYPERPTAGLFRGPESVFTVDIDKPVANFGVALVKQQAGVSVEPRIALGRDENALAGVSALPTNSNPYQLGFGDRRLIAGVLRPTPGRYTIVFDTRTRKAAGPFRFRFWLNDTRPPTIRVVGRRTVGQVISADVRDRGSGVDPASLSFRVNGGPWLPAEWDARSRRMLVDLFGLKPGRYTIGFRAADRQETKNWEYSGPVLPNTRVVSRQIRVVRDG